MPGSLFIISGPSCAGEDSVINGLKKILPVEMVVSTTSREMRPGESQKNPYNFVSRAEFEKMIKENKFLEYAEEYNSNLYVVTHEEINRVIQSPKIGIWKIEYKGVMSAKKLFPEIVAILLSAPMDILEKRMRSRGPVTEKYIEERRKYTEEWLKHKDMYDYEVVNEEGRLDETIKKVANIIEKELRKKNIKRVDNSK